jgi:hypothetical protein
MKVLILFWLTISLLVFTGAGYAQSNAQLTLSQANVDAGDSIAADLTLETPAACNAPIEVLFFLGNRSKRTKFPS